MPISRSGSSTSIPDSGMPKGTTPTEQKTGSLNGSNVSPHDTPKHLPKADLHPSALHVTTKPIRSRSAKILKVVKRVFNGLWNTIKDNPLTRRVRPPSPDKPFAQLEKQDAVTISTNIENSDEDIPKSNSNVDIAPKMTYTIEEPSVPLSDKVTFKKAASGVEDDSVEILPMTAAELKAHQKKGFRKKAKAQASTINGLRKEHYFGSTYKKTGLPTDLLQKYQNPALIIVKGSAANRFGHSLLGFESPTGERFYTQINNLLGYPEHMTEEQCAKYLALESGGVLLEYRPPLKESCEESGETSAGMQTKINDYAKGRWHWSGSLHNCYSYCLHILDAGGYDTQDLEGLGLARFPKTAIDVANKHASP